VLPFVVFNSLQALPHPMSIGAGVVRFNLIPVLTLCLFDGSLERIAGFLLSALLKKCDRKHIHRLSTGMMVFQEDI
jgi:hypothetical protein